MPDLPAAQAPRHLGVRAALVDGAWVPGDVLVADGRIRAVGVEPAKRDGGVAVPGFVDLHLNGFAGVDFLGADLDGYRGADAALAATGVTAYLATFITSPLEDYAPALHVAAQATGGLLGVHLEGPYLSPRWHGAHDPAHLRAPDLDEASRLCDAGPIRMVTLAPELPGGLDLIAALTARGVAVSLGHCDADAATANAAFDHGARAITHIYNAHRRWMPRDPGVAGTALLRDDVAVQAIVDHMHLAPETTAAAFRVARERFCLVTDGMAGAGAGPGTYRMGRREVQVHNGRAELRGGGLAGSVLTMDEAVRNLVGCGASLAEAVHAASTTPARFLGERDIGTLRPGARADITVLDDDLHVIRTLRAGTEAFARA